MHKKQKFLNLFREYGGTRKPEKVFYFLLMTEIKIFSKKGRLKCWFFRLTGNLLVLISFKNPYNWKPGDKIKTTYHSKKPQE